MGVGVEVMVGLGEALGVVEGLAPIVTLAVGVGEGGCGGHPYRLTA